MTAKKGERASEGLRDGLLREKETRKELQSRRIEVAKQNDRKKLPGDQGEAIGRASKTATSQKSKKKLQE